MARAPSGLAMPRAQVKRKQQEAGFHILWVVHDLANYHPSIMIANTLLAVLAASAQVALAAPAAQTNSAMRLIKTSESDRGTWMTEKQIFDNLTLKRKGFFDITDIKDQDTLDILSTTDDERMSIQAVTYPGSVQHVDEAKPLVDKVVVDTPKAWLTTFTNFTTRHYKSKTGTEASQWLYDTVTKVGSANKAITVERFTHSYNQPSTIARIPGESTNLVIIGAHMDSTGGSSTARSPGADDNGSGSVTILEAFRVIAESGLKPKNTLEFHWYSGEEGGLLGSQDIFAKYKKDKKTVLAMLNQDMTGFSPSKKIAIYTDYTDKPLTNYVRVIAKQYTGQDPSTTSCGYGCSDHASARANGFPAAFVNEDEFEKSNPDIHSARDSLDKIQWDAVLRHAKFTVGFVVEASHL
ncbi:Leucine aminopeptidase 1 [Cladobotryum mycophilum]|uniref:Peptide hydrolase n=1 Tax=Cladobotryum mycophilum TaxID=491253 RepID=A0ABR0SQA5_9HYPO